LTATIDTSSTAGYKYGRNLFDTTLTNSYEHSSILSNNFGQGRIPSRGESKILVVPVSFANSTETSEENDAWRQQCYTAFFGEADQTGWNSVRSYYYESSYHQLYLEGTVSPVVRMPKDYSYYQGKKSSDATKLVCDTMYKALFKGSDPIYSVDDFDSDKDGVIDGIYFINDQPVGSDLSWAFTTWYSNSSFEAINTNAFVTSCMPIGTFAWSSKDFMTRRPGFTVSSPDAHTYIHETGHLLGLNDYYDTYNSQRSIAGGGSMQDYNICDHESYSKFLWGWTSPRVITDKNTESSIEVDLKPFEDSGDSVILSAKYNDTCLDEYLMIDYYTPTKLNEADSQRIYESALGVNGSGIRIWHVDKRVYDSYLVYNDETRKYTSYFDPQASEDPAPAKDLHEGTNERDPAYPYTGAIDYYKSMSTNSSEDLTDANFYIKPELELLRSTYGTSNYKLSDVADADDLFVAGDTFGTDSDSFKDFEFYSIKGDVDYNISSDDWNKAAKVQLPYSISVESIGDTAKLVFTKK